MKTTILFPFLLLGLLLKTNATHYIGGNITYRLVDINQPLKYEVTFITYVKISATGTHVWNDSVEVYWGDGSSSFIKRQNGPDMDSNGIPDGEAVGNELQQNIYTQVHTYVGIPPAPHNYFNVSFYDHNRIDGINNIDGGNSVNVPLFLEATIYPQSIQSAQQNSSPVLLVHPSYYAQQNQPFTYNITAYDADGDSMVFELVPPQQGHNVNVPLYQLPDEYCMGNNVFNLHLHTGQLQWLNPCQPGIYAVAIKISEYRCGVLLGSIIRDMNIIVGDFANFTPRFTNPIADDYLLPGQTLQFNVTATDSDALHTLTMEAHGGPFISSNNAATFTTTAGNPATGFFSWQPGPQHAQKGAHIFSISATDDHQFQSTQVPNSSFLSFRVWVADTTTCLVAGINEGPTNTQVVKVYPNPVTTHLNLDAPELFTNYKIAGADGRVWMVEKGLWASKKIDVSLLPPGFYIIQTEAEGNTHNVRFLKGE